MNKVNLGPASVVDEIISDAGTLQTLLDCIRKEISVSPIKRELMGTYADFYEGDVRRVEDLLSASVGNQGVRRSGLQRAARRRKGGERSMSNRWSTSNRIEPTEQQIEEHMKPHTCTNCEHSAGAERRPESTRRKIACNIGGT